MSPEYLKMVIDRQFSEWMKVSSHKVATGDEVCRVILPLWEPSGDVVTVYISERDGRTVIDDGGHIAGLLFESSAGAPRKQDRNLVNRLLSESGLQKDQNSGIVEVETVEDGIRYWLIEMGRVIAMISAMIPGAPQGGTKTRIGARNTKRGRTARQLTARLVDEGYSKLIHPPHRVRGISEREHLVDVSYYTSFSPLVLGGASSKTAVHILAVDLDVAKPLEKADKSIATANDLAWSSGEVDTVDVKMVYSFGKDDGVEQPAAKLLATAGEMSSFSSYSWDDNKERAEFLARVGQELALLAL